MNEVIELLNGITNLYNFGKIDKGYYEYLINLVEKVMYEQK